MVASLILGAFLGIVLPHWGSELSIIGELFVRLLTLLVVPIVFFSILSGVLGIQGDGGLLRIGGKTLLYYLTTTCCAVLTGLILVNVIRPGVGGEPMVPSRGAIDASGASPSAGLSEVFRNMIPSNLVDAASSGNVLGLIFFALFFGIAVRHVRVRDTTPLRDSCHAIFESLIWMIERALIVAPIGFFALLAGMFARLTLEGQLANFGESLFGYTATVVLGLLIHGVITLSIILVLFRVQPVMFARSMALALTTAFSTASSSATLPITLDCITERAGVSRKIAGFVLPLGATVNMDGTAIYEAIAVVFIANLMGVELSLGQQVIVFFTATVSAIGAAGIPGAGLIMMVLILRSVGLPPEGMQYIIAVDRLLDMLRTGINVWGDSVGAAVIARSEGEPLEAITAAANTERVS